MHHSGVFGCTWLNEGEEICRFSGADFLGTLPGYGPVFGVVQRIVWYEAGCREENGEWVCDKYELLHWSGMEFWDEEAVCNYLVPEE
jgi:hypothetical protein